MSGTGGEELARDVVSRLKGRTIATAESCTAGRIAEALACVEHAADFLRGGVVAYDEDVKRELLGVTAESVLTPEAAVQMAAGAARLMHADVVVSTTGVAGDEATDGVPPGTVYIATCVDGHGAVSEHRFDGSPEEVCDHARDQALRDLIEAMR